MITISILQPIKASASEVFDTLLAHEKLGRFFDASFQIAQPAIDESGAGLVREVTMRGETFHEEIVAAIPGCIHYRIVGDKPVKQHYGSIQIIDNAQGCMVNYLITCRALWWQPSFIVSKLINKDITQGLTKLAEHFNGRRINSTGH